MQTSELSERMEATILGKSFRMMNWKTAYAVFFLENSFQRRPCAVEWSCNTFWPSHLALDRETAEQTIRRRGRGRRLFASCQPDGGRCANGVQNHHQLLWLRRRLNFRAAQR
jgi:hypothetical protein